MTTLDPKLFGKLVDPEIERIQELSIDKLDLLVDDLLGFKKVQDLIDWLDTIT